MTGESIDSRRLVDCELLPLLDLMPAVDFSSETIEEIRRQAADRYAILPPSPIAPQVWSIAGPGGQLEIYWYDPSPGKKSRPALLHIHGGGMVMGSAKLMQAGPGSIAATLNIPVASVEYRLAPEIPFPGPQEDCFAALGWLASNCGKLGVDAARIGIIGESAGGGLATATAQMTRDRSGPHLAAQFLIYPMLDYYTGSDECRYRNRQTGHFIWTRAANRYAWQALRGTYALEDARKGWFSPSLAEDLAGLPPTWIGVGSLDLFVDEDLDYARRLIDAGVAVEFHCYPGGIHAFNAVSEAIVSKAFNRDLMAAIARGLK